MNEQIIKAAEILRNGGLVAFPTETVYGLGADARSSSAVQRIFAAKGRPAGNPLIVHVADRRSAKRYASWWDGTAELLAGKFWPGPLTLVLPKKESIVTEVSAGRETVALRCPDHPLAMELLRAFDGPIAAPSANRSTRVSPTTAEHVREELGTSVDLILDGGPCRVGIESTVLDLSGDIPTILRPGAITRAQIEELIGHVEVFGGSVNPFQAAVSPGQQAVHYAPRAAAYRFTREEAENVATWCGTASPATRAFLWLGPSDAIPISLRDVKFKKGAALADKDAPENYARGMYAVIRDLDKPGVTTIFVEMPPDTPQWAAVRDRLFRATRPVSDLFRL